MSCVNLCYSWKYHYPLIPGHFSIKKWVCSFEEILCGRGGPLLVGLHCALAQGRYKCVDSKCASMSTNLPPPCCTVWSLALLASIFYQGGVGERKKNKLDRKSTAFHESGES